MANKNPNTSEIVRYKKQESESKKVFEASKHFH